MELYLLKISDSIFFIYNDFICNIFKLIKNFNAEISDKLRLRFLRGYVQIIFEKLGYKDQSYFEILDRYLDKIINYGLK